MILKLRPITIPIRGIYDCNRDGIRNEMPTHACKAHPDLHDAITAMESDGLRLVYSDIYRTAEVSLARRRYFEKKGGPQLAQPPSKSPHNFGLAIDIDVAKAIRELGIAKRDLDKLLADNYQLFCHRKDGSLGSEAWHYNALGKEWKHWLTFSSAKSTSGAIEARIKALYGNQFKLNGLEIRSALEKLGFMKPDSTPEYYETAVKSFQHKWDLDVDGIAGPETQRLLAFLTAKIEEV